MNTRKFFVVKSVGSISVMLFALTFFLINGCCQCKVTNFNENSSIPYESQFKGTILEIYPNGNLIIEPDENEQIRKSSDKISVKGSTDIMWKVGMRVIVTYTGEVMESYPAQVKTIDVKIYDEVDKSSKFDSVTMSIKEDTLSKVGTTLIFVNHSDKDYIYGEYFKIERKENGNWLECKPIIDNYGFNSIGYSLEANKTVEFDVNWKWLYGELPSGEYRITKDIVYSNEPEDFAQYYIEAEFSIK